MCTATLLGKIAIGKCSGIASGKIIFQWYVRWLRQEKVLNRERGIELLFPGVSEVLDPFETIEATDNLEISKTF